MTNNFNDSEIIFQAERLLKIAHDIVVQVRNLLESTGTSSAPSAALVEDGDTEISATGVSGNDPPAGGYPAVGTRGLICRDYDASVLHAEFARKRIHMRLGSAGRIGAGILLRFLEQPGEFISHDELARSAGMRSRSSNAIKVYVCYLRNALEEHGYSSTMIETGRRSYALRADALPDIMEFLSRP